MWGAIAVGFFSTEGGLFYSGNWELMGVQVLGLIVLCAWGSGVTWLGLSFIRLWIPVRSTEEEEDMGLDISYHGVMAAYQEHEFISYEDQYGEVDEKEGKT
ncbi:hypothetical protein [Bacillus sp. BHET2]|uniref:hypothetical protein n=1 Tax=Bacillus sp. BHET2 TaxID=2583818 RepID=UPI001F100903|nr:hypothetical protein [Bacillus sp. BHET2]